MPSRVDEKKIEYRKQMMVLENKQYEKNVNMFTNNNNSETNVHIKFLLIV